MINEACGQCKFWHEFSSAQKLGAMSIGSGKKMGMCRRLPPVLMVVPTGGGAQVMPVVPSLPEDEVACGEFKPRLQG